MRRDLALSALLGLALGGCLGSRSFHCDQDTDCQRGGVAGHCEATMYCAFDDTTCATGRRYDPTAGALADTCVGAPDASPGTPDAAPIACPPARIPACHPNGGSGPGCDPIQLTTPDATFTLGMVLRDDTLYYASGDGDIRRMSIDGLAGTSIDGPGGDSVALTADATNLYWNDYYNGQVRGAPIAPPSTPFDVTTLATTPAFGHLAVSGPMLYMNGAGGIFRAPIDGSQPTPTKVASKVDDGYDPDVSIGVAVDATDVYFTDNGRVRRIPIAMAGNDTAASDFALAPGAGELALDADRVYWASTDGIAWRNKDGTGLTVLPVGDTRARGVALDDQHVYWTTPDGHVMRVVKGGAVGDIEIVAAGVADPYDLVVDCGAVYWGIFKNGNRGTVYKARLP